MAEIRGMDPASFNVSGQSHTLTIKGERTLPLDQIRPSDQTQHPPMLHLFTRRDTRMTEINSGFTNRAFINHPLRGGTTGQHHR